MLHDIFWFKPEGMTVLVTYSGFLHYKTRENSIEMLTHADLMTL